jgi:RNA polymerase sigma-70 factor (ECF subfamily)
MGEMGDATLVLAEAEDGRAPRATDRSERPTRRLLASHFDFIWRSLRRLGVPEPAVDDAAQQVFIVAARKMDGMTVERERSYLFAIALRVAADERRARRRRPETSEAEPGSALADPAPSPEELVDWQRARAAADEILEELPLEVRVVFILFEMEDIPTKEIAKLLDLPMGTVASRLRRGRELFQAGANRWKARSRGGSR